MIKDFITYVNEDYFSKLANRKDTQTSRKEKGRVIISNTTGEKINVPEDDIKMNNFYDNIERLQPVDLELPSGTIWYNGYVGMYDEDGLLTTNTGRRYSMYFTMKDLGKMVIPKGYTIPTIEQIKELISYENTTMDYSKKMWNFTSNTNGNKISFHTSRGYYAPYDSLNDCNDNKETYFIAITSEGNKSGTIKPGDIVWCRLLRYNFTTIGGMHAYNKKTAKWSVHYYEEECKPNIGMPLLLVKQ